MATNFEWFKDKVVGLTSDLNRKQSLSDLHIAVSSQTSSQRSYIAENLALNPIFDCLNSSESEEIELASQILIKLLGSLDSAFVLGQYGSALQRALSHPSVSVKSFALGELQLAAKNVALMPELCQTDLLLKVIRCLSHDDLRVAKDASTLLVSIGKTTVGLKALFCEKILEGFDTVKKERDVVRYRVYEVFVEMAEYSPAGLLAGVECGMLPALVDEFKTDDVLLQMNSLEVLTRLAVTKHGLEYLERQNLLDLIADKIDTLEGVEATIVLPGIMKFFGNVAHSNPKEFFCTYPKMVIALFHTLESSDLVMAGVALETVGYIATTREGKDMLNTLGESMQNAMKVLASRITNSPTEMRVRALNALANIITLKVPDQDTVSLALTKSWFEALSENPMKTVMAICRQPFPELKIAGLQVLKILAVQSWGQEHLRNYPGLIEFLLDRSLESVKACKDAKFDVIRTIVESPTAAAIFGEEIMQRLEEYVHEGPFYVRAQTEVAIEGTS